MFLTLIKTLEKKTRGKLFGGKLGNAATISVFGAKLKTRGFFEVVAISRKFSNDFKKALLRLFRFDRVC